MRLVLVVTRFPQLSETFIVSKWLGLLKLGWDAHILCQYSPESAWDLYPELRDRPELRRRVHVRWPTHPRIAMPALYPLVLGRTAVVSPSGFARFLRASGGRTSVNFAKRAYVDARLVELRPRLVHFEFGALAVGHLDAPRALDAKVVVSFRGYDLNLSGLGCPGHFREVFEQADMLHLLGDGLWRRAVERGCPADTPHVLIPPAIDPVFWRRPQQATRRSRERSADDGPLRLVAVGRLEWQKGYEWLLVALRRIVDDGIDAHLTIIGGGGHMRALGFAVHDLGLDRRVTVAGGVPRAEVRQLLSGADVFVHGAVTEGFCNAVLEAQAMELPVITTDAGGLPENVSDGVTGLIVPRRDPGAMAAAIRRLAEDPGLRRRLGAAGRERATLPQFQIHQQIRRFDDVYRELLDR